MPTRKIPFITNEYYHIYNRTIDKVLSYKRKRDYQRFVLTLQYYMHCGLQTRLSKYLQLNVKEKQSIFAKLTTTAQKHVVILSFCLMPNHFHVLLKQTSPDGITKFMSQLQNSYTRYFNTKYRRLGPLFLDQFGAVRIEKDEQLLHVHRYIHLNPYSSFIVKSLDGLLVYEWSSLKEYINQDAKLCVTDDILSYFKDKKHYLEFILDQADYQRKLKQIEHLLLERD